MSDSKRFCRRLAEAVLLMAALHAARYGVKCLFFLAVPRTNFADRMASMLAMTLLSAALLIAARVKGIKLSVFPRRFGAGYIAAAAVSAALVIATPVITGQNQLKDVLLLVYAAVITPIFEELIFRGLIWNRLAAALRRPWQVWAATALLFALWHLGYADALALRAPQGALGRMLFWKAVTGLGFGAVLGGLRCWTGNCFSTMLLHGVLNAIGK